MSRLQLKNRGLDTSQFKRIIAFTAGAHILALFCMLFVSLDAPIALVVKNTHGARVVCLPAFMLPATRTVAKSNASLGQKKTEPIPAHPAVPAIASGDGWERSRSGSGRKQNLKALRAKMPKQAPTRLFSSIPKLQKKKRQFSTPDQSDYVCPSLQTRQTSTDRSPEEVTPELEEKKIEEQQAPEAVSSETSAAAEDIIYVDKETYAVLQLARELQQAISSNWRPPAGVASDVSCDIQVLVRENGSVAEMALVKKSGLAAYDMAARTALQKTDYPKAVWGRTILVHFDEEFACGGS